MTLSSETQNIDIQDIVSETAQYHSLLESEDWEQLQILMLERQKKLELFFSLPIPKEDRDDVLNAIKEINQFDETYKQKIAANKISSINNANNFKKKYKAAMRYANNNE